MKLSSPAFKNKGFIPSKYTCNYNGDGEDISPELIIENIPEDTKSLALIMDDPDAPGGTFVHWLIWDIPPTKTKISEGELLECPQGKNDFGQVNYNGPCPPSGIHRYYFKLYALSAELDLRESSTKKELLAAMENSLIEKAELIGMYQRD